MAAAAVDVVAARAEVLAAEAAWMAAIEAHDVEGVVAFFEPDGLSLPPDEPEVAGQDVRRAWLAAMFAEPEFDSTWQTTRVDISAAGDMALSVGTTAHGAGADAEGRSLVEAGKYVTVWRRGDDGAWRVAADIWNGSGPPVAE